MSVEKVLHTAAVKLANGKVAEIKIVAKTFGRNHSTTIVDMTISADGRKVIENVGSIEPSSHPDRTHAFYPANKVRRSGIGPTFGSLAEVRTGAVAAAMFRMGGAAANIAAKVKESA